MRHQQRWTDRKIAQRIALIEPLVYRSRSRAAAFRYLPLPSPSAPPPVAPDVDDSAWQVIPPDAYWGAWRHDFVLRTRFSLPADWAAGPGRALPAAGRRRRFQPPRNAGLHRRRALSAVDRHHQEVRLPAQLLRRAASTSWRCTAGWAALRRRPDRQAAHARLRAGADRPAARATFIALARVRAGHRQRPGRERARPRAAAQRAGRRLQAPGHARAVRRGVLRQRARPRWQRCATASRAAGAAAAGARSPPPGTPTSTWPGCGRWARPGARPGAPSTPCCA